MSNDQLILNAMIERYKQGKNMLLTGQAGTGKTYMLNKFLEWMRDNDYITALAGSTGVAAINIGGTTVHRMFGIGRSGDIEDHLRSLKFEEPYRINHRKKLKELIEYDLIIIDEISMIGTKVFELLDFILRKGTGLDEPFGGMQVLFTGDFLQLPPINDDFCFLSPIWKDAEISVIHLTKVHRQSNLEFLEVLTKLRIGEYDKQVEDFIGDKLYEGMPSEESTKLYAMNKSVDEENNRMIAMLPGKKKTFICETSGPRTNVDVLVRGLAAPETLELKVGAKVMALINDSELAYVNGSIGHVTKISGQNVVVEFEDGERELFEPYTWEAKDAEGNVIATFTQIPLRLAYAITMHKSQGMTIDGELFVDCKGIRSDGQFYVAMSRIKDPSKLKILNFRKDIIKASVSAKSFYGY